MMSLFSGTPVALLAGATAVTVGGNIVVCVTGVPFKPNIGLCPPPLQPDNKAPTNRTPNQDVPLAYLFKNFIFSPNYFYIVVAIDNVDVNATNRNWRHFGQYCLSVWECLCGGAHGRVMLGLGVRSNIHRDCRLRIIQNTQLLREPAEAIKRCRIQFFESSGSGMN
jgi:hypothetical protein